MIIEDILLSYGADYKNFETNQLIFAEGDTPSYYFQVVQGKIKVNNYSDQGKEFIQGIVYIGGSPVVTALFNEKPYPANAVAFEECKVLRLPKERYFKILKQNPELYENILPSISENMHYNYIMMQTLSFQSPENRLITIMNYFKDYHKSHSPYSYQIPFTRQQLASLAGLSVETVIRVIKNMEKNEILKIQNRKILY